MSVRIYIANTCSTIIAAVSLNIIVLSSLQKLFELRVPSRVPDRRDCDRERPTPKRAQQYTYQYQQFLDLFFSSVTCTVLCSMYYITDNTEIQTVEYFTCTKISNRESM